MGRYKICGKYMVGSDIVGYEVEGEGEGRKLLRVGDMYKLVECGEVEGCEVVEYGGDRYIKVDGGVSKLPLSTKGLQVSRLKVKERVLKDGEVVGYVLEDMEGNSYRLARDKVWHLSLLGLVEGVEAKAYKDKKILTGVKDLPFRIL